MSSSQPSLLPKRIPLFAANWKMNKALSEVAPYCSTLIASLPQTHEKAFQIIIAPPATHLFTLAKLTLTPNIKIETAAQNAGPAKSGAFTGEISPTVLKELQVHWVILGHSERRHIYGENDTLILSRIRAAIEEDLEIIFCVGEKIEERKAGKTFSVLHTQLEILKQLDPFKLGKIVIAYEPVWAIGTGETATPKQAQEVHSFIREWIKSSFGVERSQVTRILYGGSVKPENAEEIMAETDVDGLLVGGASLEPKSFASLIQKGLSSKP